MYYNDELNRHKKSDTAKWVITFILIILLILAEIQIKRNSGNVGIKL